MTGLSVIDSADLYGSQFNGGAVLSVRDAEAHACPPADIVSALQDKPEGLARLPFDDAPAGPGDGTRVQGLVPASSIRRQPKFFHWSLLTAKLALDQWFIVLASDGH